MAKAGKTYGEISRWNIAFFVLALLLPLGRPEARVFSGNDRTAGLEISLQEPLAEEYSRQVQRTPAEFAPASELQMTSETFRRMSHALVGTIDQTTDIVVIVKSRSEERKMISDFAAIGGNTARLHPTVMSYNSIWYQDYGPIYSFDISGKLISNDFIYSRYNRRSDDAVPASLASVQNVVNRSVSMDFEGGNFISDGNGTCFASNRVYQQNPKLSEAQVKALMQANLGCQQLVTLAPLVDDITFHIDLYAKLVSDNTFLVGDFVDHAENKKLMDKNAQILQSMGYAVIRLPVRSRGYRDFSSHINSFLINGYALVPAYGIAEDKTAEAVYAGLGYRVLMVNVSDLGGMGGAIHCILRSKPLH